MEDELGLVTEFLFGQDDGGGHGGIVEQPFEFRQALPDQLAQTGCNGDVTTRDIETHPSRELFSGWKWESSALRGISRWCGARASALPSAGCSRSWSHSAACAGPRSR